MSRDHRPGYTKDSGTEPLCTGIGAEDRQVGLLSAARWTPLREAAVPGEARWPSPRTDRQVQGATRVPLPGLPAVTPPTLSVSSQPRGPRHCPQHVLCPLPLCLFSPLTAKCPIWESGSFPSSKKQTSLLQSGR